MAQREVELILVRQLAGYLALPIFLVDSQGTLLFYNEPAEQLLGLRYEDTGEMTADAWGTVFIPRDDEGQPLPTESLPLVRCLQSGRAVHGRMVIEGMDGARRMLDVTSLPLVGQSGRPLGAMAVFWEVEP